MAQMGLTSMTADDAIIHEWYEPDNNLEKMLCNTVYVLNADGMIHDIINLKDESPDFMNQSMVGKHIQEIIKVDSSNKLFENIEDVLKTEKAGSFKFVHISKELHKFEIRLTPGNDKKFYMTSSTITKDDRTEESRDHFEKLLSHYHRIETIGNLTGGIVHDINNLLMIIESNAHLALNETDAGDSLQYYINGILQSSGKCTSLTRLVMNYIQMKASKFEVIDLNNTIRGMDAILQTAIGRKINMRLVMDDAKFMIKTSPGQVEQIIMNLIINARDAMRSGGNLIIQTARVQMEELVLLCLTTKPGPYVKLTIQDTGCGMEEDMKKNIFKPFFTTKSEDRGTGLGLAIVHRAVQLLNGFIDVQSRPGEGTKIDIYLPLCTEDEVDHLS
jgi:two-component system, cell cycle sensor histidine kinase and response regulator CckA